MCHWISTEVTVQDMERLRQTHQEELLQQQEEQNKDRNGATVEPDIASSAA